VPYYDRNGLAELARDLHIEVPELDHLEERLCGRNVLGLAMAAGSGNVDAVLELKLRDALPELGRSLLAEAARSPCVICVPTAFAALHDHSAATHIRIRAPFPWRLAAYQREHLVARHQAEKALKHADRLEHAWVRMLYRRNPEDAEGYTLTLDASRFSDERLLETLLAAGGSTVRRAA
jgi:hypothetical protein